MLLPGRFSKAPVSLRKRPVCPKLSAHVGIILLKEPRRYSQTRRTAETPQNYLENARMSNGLQGLLSLTVLPGEEDGQGRPGASALKNKGSGHSVRSGMPGVKRPGEDFFETFCFCCLSCHFGSEVADSLLLTWEKYK